MWSSSGLADFDRALELNPAQLQVLNTRVTYHYQNENWAEAEADISRLIELLPATETLYYTRAGARENIAFQTGDRAAYAGAVDDYERSIELCRASFCHINLYHLGELHLFFDEDAAALEAFNRALEINPDHANSLYERGLLVVQSAELRDCAAAQDDLERLETVNSDRADELREAIAEACPSAP